MQESFDEIAMRLSNEFAPVIEKDADTLVYLGVPPPTPGQDPYEYDYMERLFRIPYLMKSATLQAAGSSKFQKLLGPMSARTSRRLKKLEVHKSVMQPDSIKYYVDASPALNDDEALIQITELSVPHGALRWHQLSRTLGIPELHICGRDELNAPARPTYALSVPKDFSEDNQGRNADNKLGGNTDKGPEAAEYDSKKECPPAPAVVDLPLAEEYTALRHHTATARLFHALAGNDPRLNSAAKAWTFCMLANYFDCAHSPVISHWVVSWLLENGNSHFIQNNPEIAYRMAVATQSTWLIRCTFAILVGQQAMIQGTNDAVSTASAQPQSRHACHVASCLDDDDINRIDHAASALTHRIREVLEEVAMFPGIWNTESSSTKEIAKLNGLVFDDSEYQALLQTIKDQLRDYVRRIIYMTLSPSYDLANVKGVSPFEGFGMFAAYTNIPQPLKLLTQHFWNILRLEQFARDYTDTGENHHIWEQTQAGLKQQGIITANNVPYVSRKELFANLDKLNAYLSSPAGRPQAQAKLLDRPGTSETPSPSKTVKPSQKRRDWCCLQCGAEYGSDKMSTDVPRKDLYCVVCGKILIQNEAANKEKKEPAKTGNVVRHHRGASDDIEPLLQKFNSSSIGPEAVTQQPMNQSADLLEEVIDATDQDGDWQDVMEDLHPIRASAPEGLAIYRKSVASASQPTNAGSRQIARGKMGQHTGTGSVIASASGGSQLVEVPCPPDWIRPIGTFGGAQRSLMHRSHHSSYTGSSQDGTMGKMTEEHPWLQDVAPAQYDRLSDDSPDDPTTAANKTQHLAVLQPDDAPPFDDSEDKDLTDQRRTSVEMADNKDYRQAMQEPTHCGVAFDLTVQTMPTAVSRYFEQSTAERTGSLVRTWESIDAVVRPVMPTALLQEVSTNLYCQLSSIVTPGYILDGTCDFDIPNGKITTLLCLNDNEWKYLPLWAGGLDDGTGGVFNDGVEVPDAPDVEDGGFRGGAMGIIPGVGSSIGGSIDGGGSEFEEIMTEVGVSTVGKASRIATDGTATETVISMDE